MNNYDFGDSLIRERKKSEPVKNSSFADKIKHIEDHRSEPVRFIRPVRINARTSENVNHNVVAYSLYNCFNYSIFFPEDRETIRCSLGITSPNASEGKTTAACNLAASLALGSNRKTVIVDLNIHKPRIHEIFGTSAGPGLTEALIGEEIFVTPTQIENLFIMTAGNAKVMPIKNLSAFHDIAASLLNRFEFLIVDMPSLNARSFPTLIANLLNGLIVVVEARKTRRRDIDKAFRQVNEKNVVGFVINKISENDF